MKTLYLTGKEPGVPELLRAAFPSFAGRKISVQTRTEVQPQHTYWDEGSRHSYSAVDIKTRRAVAGKQFSPPQFGGPVKVNPIRMVPGVLVFELHQHRGTHYMHIYCHPQDAPKLLPEEGQTLTKEEKIVLEHTAGLKSSYGGEKNFRFKEARRRTGITLNEWEVAKAELMEKKLLNRAGAITTAGRNAIA